MNFVRKRKREKKVIQITFELGARDKKRNVTENQAEVWFQSLPSEASVQRFNFYS